MEVNGQVHTPAALTKGEEPLVPPEQKPGCAPGDGLEAVAK